MFTLLSSLLQTVQQLGALVLWAGIEVINSFLAAVQLLFLAAAAALPSLPATPVPPSFIKAINWFFPVGSIVSLAGSLLTAYIAFLAVRYVFRKVGAM